jgi:hypothetical protein
MHLHGVDTNIGLKEELVQRLHTFLIHISMDKNTRNKKYIIVKSTSIKPSKNRLSSLKCLHIILHITNSKKCP